MSCDVNAKYVVIVTTVNTVLKCRGNRILGFDGNNSATSLSGFENRLSKARTGKAWNIWSSIENYLNKDVLQLTKI